MSSDSGDGALISGYKSEASGIGPAVMWVPGMFDGRLTLIAKWLDEYDAENRLEGEHFFASFVLSF